jgi:hypothetical protein
MSTSGIHLLLIDRPRAVLSLLAESRWTARARTIQLPVSCAVAGKAAPNVAAAARAIRVVLFKVFSVVRNSRRVSLWARRAAIACGRSVQPIGADQLHRGKTRSLRPV